MSIFDILRRNTDGESEEEQIPDKPDDAGERKSKTEEYTVYQIELEYRNGDTETIEEAYGYDRGGTNFEYASKVGHGYSWFSNEPYLKQTWDTAAHYETLNREPVVEEVRTETWVVEYTRTYTKRMRYDGTFREWEAGTEDIEVREKDEP